MKQRSFEKIIEESKDKLDKLMNSDIDLNSSIKLYKEGMNDLKEASKLLQDAKLEYETINAKDDE